MFLYGCTNLKGRVWIIFSKNSRKLKKIKRKGEFAPQNSIGYYPKLKSFSFHNNQFNQNRTNYLNQVIRSFFKEVD